MLFVLFFINNKITKVFAKKNTALKLSQKSPVCEDKNIQMWIFQHL